MIFAVCDGDLIVVENQIARSCAYIKIEVSSRSVQTETRGSIMNDTTVRGLVRHWGWASDKGLINASTARALATACRGVLEIQENWEDLEVSAIDVDDSFSRFSTLRAKDFTPKSLRTYESRFRRAVASYRRYLDDPSSWRYESRTSAGQRSPASDRPQESPRPRFPGSGGSGKVTSPDVVSEQSGPVGGLQMYLYPIRPDVLARLVIPRDATAAEINRLVAWARTLATDYEPSS